MPQVSLDPKDRKPSPTGLQPARKNKRWEHVDRLGDWFDVVPSKKETTVLRDDERATGLIKLDRDVKFRDGKLEAKLIDMEVKDGIGTVDSPGSGTPGDSDGATRAAVDAGGVPAGRAERVVPG